MTDVTDLAEVFSETLARVRARMDADANAGLTYDNPAWIDLREGSFYWDMTQPPAIECARLWDAMTETAAAAFPSTAWGDYLDEHGATFGLTRTPASAATGSLLFTASAATLIAAGTQASSQDSSTGDVVTFQTTASGTTSVPLAIPGGVSVAAAQSGGSLSAGTRYYHVTALNAYGETTGSGDQSGVTTSAAGVNTITWTAVPGATSYRVYVSQTPNTMGALLASPTATSYADNGAVTPNPASAEPQVNTSSGILLSAQALDTGTVGNVGAGAIISLDTVVPAVLAVTNPSPMDGGREEEADDDFREQILGEYLGTSGGGNVTDYKRWADSQGVTRVAVVPVWAGPGTVLVIAMNSDGTPVSTTVISALQTFLDPVPGQGAGQAPIGATVTVVTSTVRTITISAAVKAEPGYSLDGTAGTIATRAAILASLGSYLTSLQPTDTIVYQHVQAAFFVTGVHQVNGLTVNGASADIALGTNQAPQVAILGTATLTDA